MKTWWVGQDKIISTSSNNVQIDHFDKEVDSNGLDTTTTYFNHICNANSMTTAHPDYYAYKIVVKPRSGNSIVHNSNVISARVACGTYSDVLSFDCQQGRDLDSSMNSTFFIVTNHTEIYIYLAAQLYCYESTTEKSYSRPDVVYDAYYDVELYGYYEEDEYQQAVTDELNEQTGIMEDQLEQDKAQTEELKEQTGVMEDQLDEAEEQTETQKGILSSIKDFFGSFFDNLINSIIGIFVPSSEEMSGLFDRLNQFFSDTFGFLYYPFDFIIRAFDVFLSADSETGLTLPGFSIMGYQVWSDTSFDLASMGVVNDIFGYVRIGTGVILAMAFISYLRNFFDKRFGGGGS